MTFEIIERFSTVGTTVKRLARRTAELADKPGMIGMAMRTFYRFLALE